MLFSSGSHDSFDQEKTGAICVRYCLGHSDVLHMTPLQKAHYLTLTGLLEIIPEEESVSNDPTSLGHLRWMINECINELETYPIDKISRWIGFVQGVLTVKGILSTEGERNRTRPFFHEAYEAMGISIPRTKK